MDANWFARPDPALSDRAKSYAAQVQPHIPANAAAQDFSDLRGVTKPVLAHLTGLSLHQVGLGIASLRAQVPETPLLTLPSKADGRTKLYLYDPRPESVQRWRVTRVRILYTIAKRTWTGALYQMTLAMPERERALAQLQYRQFLETIEAVAAG